MKKKNIFVVSKMSTMRNVCFTSFKENISIDESKCVYYILGKEICPTTGKKHIQGFIQLKSPNRLSGVKKLIGDDSAHIENMRGTAKEASDYCKKDKDFVEFGELRFQGKRTDLIDLKKKVIDGISVSQIVIDDCENYQQIKFVESLKRYVSKSRNFKTKVYWFYGDTGSGKTKTAYEMFPNAYFKMSGNKWWDGYEGQEDVIIDDLRQDDFSFNYLLQLFDRYPMRVELKGSSVEFVSKNIVVTCPFRPEKLFCDKNENLSQMIRRIDEFRNF